MAFLSGVLGNYAGQAERAKDDRAQTEARREFDVSQAGEDKRNQAYVDSMNAGVQYKNAQTDQLRAKIEAMPAEEQRAAILAAAKLGLIDAQVAEIWLGRIPHEQAQTTLVGAQTNLTNANTKKVLQGEIPLLVAQTAYQRQRPEFERAQLAEKYYALQDQDKRTADEIASRIQIAGANDATKRSIAAIMVQSGLYKQDEGFALKSAIDEYNNEFKSYLQQSNPRYADPTNPQQPQPPSLKIPININTGGEQSLLTAALANLLRNRGGNGQQQPSTSSTNPPPPPPANPKDEVARARAAIAKGAPRAQVEATLRKRIGDAAYQQLYVGTQVAPQVPIGKPVIQGISPALLGQ